MTPLSRYQRGPRWPRADGFALASTLSLVLFGALVWNAFVARDIARRAMTELADREAVQNELLRLDERLQTTTRSAVATRKADGWIDAHRRAAADLAATFDRMEREASSAQLRAALDEAERARGLKTSIEDRAFDALVDGSTEEARLAIQQLQYHEQRHQFSHAMQHFESAQLADAIEGTRRADVRLQGSILWATGLFVLLTGLWISLLCSSHRRERLRAREIEERTRAQRELADSLSMYRSLFEASHDMVLLVDARSESIVDANRQACAALGRTRANLSSLRFVEVCDSALSAVDDDEGISTHLRCRDGRRIPCTLRRRRVSVRDREFLQIAARDLSTCQSLEAQLHTAQRMESVGQLAGGIAHEFSNLALVLAGQASLMRDGIDRDRPITDALDRIEAVAAEARRISRSLLCFSGRSRPDRRPVDVRAVARGTVDLLVHVLPPGIRLETDGLQGTPLLARSDEGEIEQILLNLALNARDAMPSGGTLWISCTADDDELELVVGDTGTGISDSDLERIFDPLFTTKPPGSGTGLGLSIVDRIVRQLGGRIRVQTRCGQGSSFTVNLPRLMGDPMANEGERARPLRAARTLTVRLLVDNAAARHLLRTEFEARGHRVHDGPASGAVLLRADVAILVGPPPPGPPGPLATRLRAGHVIRVAPARTSSSSDPEEDSVVFVGVAAPLEELVRLSENLAQLGTGGAK